ncbi:hypothetical protein SAMN05443637_13518 [Pseudonocardia thermophila]|jgi:hypothetical protein|uniref:Uncharacterized protein n=1 Tax=Pseudonocardia thermophila TaxID=1848 RepID=A0A1M7BDQ0_PSETH|nr:hypothetical protein [Pseudonocardia thermophila]SHL53155.1 hypothetical protein SAMN05443637_13518 [Pseudonocardia thermophila]
MPQTTTRRRRPATKTTTPAKTAAASAPAEQDDYDETVAAVVDLPGTVVHTVQFERDGVVEEHTFTARPRMTYKRMADIVKARRSGDGVDALAAFERMIRPALLDDDGTPANWEPEVRGGVFIDPDGNERPVEDLQELLAFENGSSRRRWIHLMDKDDYVDVEMGEISDFYERLFEEASERPTQRPSRSSRR